MKLREYRELQGLTQKQVGEAVNLAKSTVSEIERGLGCSLDAALRIERWTNGAVRPFEVQKQLQSKKARKC